MSLQTTDLFPRLLAGAAAGSDGSANPWCAVSKLAPMRAPWQTLMRHGTPHACALPTPERIAPIPTTMAAVGRGCRKMQQQ